MTEVVFRPLEALKLSIQPKKMVSFLQTQSQTQDQDDPDSEEPDQNPLPPSLKSLQNIVINVTDNYKTYDRNLVLERLKKNHKLMT